LSIRHDLSRFETKASMRISASTSNCLNLHPRNAGAGARDKSETPIRAALPAVITPPDRPQEPDHGMRHRVNAPFLAQLVAGIEDMPTTRVRRRADAAIANECYRGIAGLAGGHPHARIRLI
jgi:hypothetical protein